MKASTCSSSPRPKYRDTRTGSRPTPRSTSRAHAAYAEAAVEVLGPQITRVQGACARAGVGAVLGVNERLAGTRTCFNSQVFIDPDGTLLRVHRKLQPCPLGNTILFWPATSLRRVAACVAPG
ncbi:nitrilase-related carbon-nitrogen hydrolase [Streptomyces sp. FXJ1.4098]|nr:nitrilase-related carbon-nitrogen hydrolase [Streptomyces sp. FXJ1.4098]